MSIGIYKIILGEYYYIGSSNNIQRRITKHLQHLRRGTHINPFLQNVYNKHSGTWKVKVLEETVEQDLLAIEQKYLDIHYGKDGCLNLVPTANKPPSARGRKQPKWVREKISEGKKGWDPSKETRQNMSFSARRRHKTVPFYLVSDAIRLGPFYTFKEVKQAGIMDDSSACELYNNRGGPTRKGYKLERINLS